MIYSYIEFGGINIKRKDKKKIKSRIISEKGHKRGFLFLKSEKESEVIKKNESSL